MSELCRLGQNQESLLRTRVQEVGKLSMWCPKLSDEPMRHRENRSAKAVEVVRYVRGILIYVNDKESDL